MFCLFLLQNHLSLKLGLVIHLLAVFLVEVYVFLQRSFFKGDILHFCGDGLVVLMQTGLKFFFIKRSIAVLSQIIAELIVGLHREGSI